MKTHHDPIEIVSGKGVYLTSSNGSQYLDGISSWWVNLHGHSHPYIASKIAEQAHRLEHVIFAGFTHPQARRLSEELIEILPGEKAKVFYSDNGSTAVETGLKIALQYWHNLNQKRTKVVAFRGGYHGDTFGAMSCAGKTPMNQPFWDLLFDVITITPPVKGHEEKRLQEMREALLTDDVACFIYEPIIQGASGMILHSSSCLDLLLRMCHEKNVITIADEVMTGFGRTGPLFASEYMDNKPEIICLAKGITGGFMPLGATACSEKIYRPFHRDEKSKAFLHGHSYTANPIACTSALASLDLLKELSCGMSRIKIAKKHQLFVEKWKGHSKLKRCESLGTILVLEYHDPDASYFSLIGDSLYDFFMIRGLLLRPLGNVLYVMPPYSISEQELNWIYECIESHLEIKR